MKLKFTDHKPGGKENFSTFHDIRTESILMLIELQNPYPKICYY